MVEEKDWRGYHTSRIQGSGVSRTSQIVALIRAELDRPHTPEGDPEAQRRLCAGMRPTSATWLRPNIVARTRFFDEQVLEAISTGVRQVAICGAGYDDWALRFHTTGVRFYELDHPGTQTDKAKRLRTMRTNMQGLTLVPADFRSDDVVSLLHAAGHDASQPTLFICEGLFVYLDQQSGLRLLSGVRFLAASGSTLAASLAVHREGANSNQVATATNASRLLGQTEPWLTILSVRAWSELLKQTGWHVDHTSDSVDLEADANKGRMLLMAARPVPVPN